MEYANVVSASAAAAFLDASTSSPVAPAAIIAAYFARFANVAMTPAFCARRAAFACMALSCLIVSSSIAARSRSASLLVFRSKCCKLQFLLLGGKRLLSCYVLCEELCLFGLVRIVPLQHSQYFRGEGHMSLMMLPLLLSRCLCPPRCVPPPGEGFLWFDYCA